MTQDEASWKHDMKLTGVGNFSYLKNRLLHLIHSLIS